VAGSSISRVGVVFMVLLLLQRIRWVGRLR
jgi:hypothetical protein